MEIKRKPFGYFESDPKERFPEILAQLSTDFMRMPMAITEELLDTLARGDPELEVLKVELLKCSARYAEFVLSIHNLSLGSIDGQDEALEYVEKQITLLRLQRTVVDSFNIFSRALVRRQRDNSWMLNLCGQPTAYVQLALGLAFHHYSRVYRIFSVRP